MVHFIGCYISVVIPKLVMISVSSSHLLPKSGTTMPLPKLAMCSTVQAHTRDSVLHENINVV